MSKVLFFMMVSANGFYERGRWDDHPDALDWHNTDAEFERFAAEQLDAVGTLLFGRVTYEGMASYWPTPEGIAGDPEVAGRMNALPKVVFSTTLERAEWENTRVVRGDPGAEIARLKRESGADAMLLASSDLAVSLAGQDLIDEYRILVNPVALAQGKPLLRGLPEDLRLRLLGARTFASGNVLLTYEPATRPAPG